MGENKEFSDWVKRAKVATTEKGVTIVEIAEELGTATNYLYGIMSGRVFSQPMIQRVSDYLGIEGVAKRDKKELSVWCKNAKIAMLSQGISTNQLADSTGMRREYVSSILNGCVVSQPAIQKISDFLNIACNAL